MSSNLTEGTNNTVRIPLLGSIYGAFGENPLQSHTSSVTLSMRRQLSVSSQ